MRSVKDTFILSKNKNTRKILSLRNGINLISDCTIKKESMIFKKYITEKDFQKNIMAAFGVLVHIYKKVEIFKYAYIENKDIYLCTNEMNAEESIKNNINNMSCLKDKDLFNRNKNFEILDVIFMFSQIDINKFKKSFNLLINFVEDTERIVMDIYYKNDIYSITFVHQIIEHLFGIYNNILSKNIIMKLKDINICTFVEKQAVLDKIKNLSNEINYNYSITDIFREKIDKFKNRVAIHDESGDILYSEVENISNKIASLLFRRGVKKEDFVAIIGTRSKEMIISILGVLKCGAAYVPIDKELPISRINYILQDSDPKLIIMLSDINEIDNSEKAIVTWNDFKKIKEVSFYARVNPENYAYVLYTSGTSGNPKGVLIKHNSVVNLSKWFHRKYNLEYNKNILHMTNISFDVSVEETLVALLNFATIYIIPQEITLIREKFLRYLKINKINIAQFVPITLKNLLENTKKIESLNIVICGGDKLDDETKNNILKQGYELFNHYGPTECTVDALTYKCAINRNYIGHPIDNTEIYVVDAKNNLQPFCVPGELCIAGAGISAGYLNRKKLTEEKFVENPFTNNNLMYKTGDLVIMLPDGNIDFIGRIDQQVKINGLRIELEEIEFQIAKCANIKNVVVVVKKNKLDNKHLCAYYVSDKKIKVDKLKERLAEYLPQYMVPSSYISLSKFPLNANGKLDRELLSNYEETEDDYNEYVLPKNNIEKELLQVWKKILGTNEIGVNSKFENLGGDSLKATVLSVTIFEKYRVSISIGDIISGCTIEKMAHIIGEYKHSDTLIEDENIILLKRGTCPNKNIFFVHAGNGEAEVFLDLCDNLNSDYNMWGIRADRLTKFAPLNMTLSDVAKKYVHKIKLIQPKGPYNLVGWCIGGSIAFEMALQCEKQGDKLDNFIMINSFAPDKEFWGQVPLFSMKSELNEISKLPSSNNILEIVEKKVSNWKEVWNNLVEYYDKISLNPQELKKYVYDDMDRAIPGFHTKKIKVKNILYYLNVLRTFDNVRALYVPNEKMNVKCHVIRATDEMAANIEKWNKYCNKPIEIHDTTGNNFSIFQYPNVKGLANILENIIFEK